MNRRNIAERYRSSCHEYNDSSSSSVLPILIGSAIVFTGFYWYLKFDQQSSLPADHSVGATYVLPYSTDRVVDAIGQHTKQSPPLIGTAFDIAAHTGFPSGSSQNYVVLPGLNFAHNSDLLLTGNNATLQVVANLQKEGRCTALDITGHTDSTGREEYNMRLSVRRARVVALELMRLGVQSDNISIHGYGAKRPLSAETSHQDRARNRRVEVGCLTG